MKSEIDLERIAEQMAANRMGPKKRDRLERIGDAERERRRVLRWRSEALDWIEEVRTRVPPSGWAFFGKLGNHFESASKKEHEQIAYSDAEARDWRSFVVWHESVSKDLTQLVDLLVEHNKRPCDAMLHQSLVDAGHAIVQRYRVMATNTPKRILWMPQHWFRVEKGNRAPCTVVEYAADALAAFEIKPAEKFTHAEFATSMAGLRKELKDVHAKYAGAPR